MINRKIDAEFKNWIADNKDRIIEKWIALAEIPSIKGEAQDKAPFGQCCAEALNKAASYFNSENIYSEVFDDDGYALAHYGNGEKTIGLFSHSDVVPVGDDWIYTKPFEPVIKDGALIGRGVEDNKSGIIASLCVMEFLRDNNINLNSHLQLFIGSDEECGMGDMKGFLKNQKMPEISIVPDADFPCSTGEKGIYHFMMESNDKFSEIKSISGGEAYNIVLDNVSAVIKYSDNLFSELEHKAVDTVSVSKADESIVITAKGIAKHASIPEGSVNAAYLLFNLLMNCDNLCQNDKNILRNAAEAISDYYGRDLGINHEDPDFGKTTAVNGMIRTEDSKLHVSFDIRYGSTLSSEKLEATTDKAVASYGFRIVEKDNRQGFTIDKSSPVPAMLESVFEEVTGERLKSVLMSGGTYARKLNNAFSIGTFYITSDRKDKILKMPDGHGGAHQCDEMIDIEGFFEGTRILLHYILACDELLAD